jgi:hypothetical protein
MEQQTFDCPNCGTCYKVVRVEAPATAGDREIVCLSCGAPLNEREGKFVLKYFRVKPAKIDPRKR